MVKTEFHNSLQNFTYKTFQISKKSNLTDVLYCFHMFSSCLEFKSPESLYTWLGSLLKRKSLGIQIQSDHLEI